jgi:hypothetical protein
MSKHTPGPWQLFRDDEREMYDVCIPSTVGIRGIAEISFGYSEPAETEQHANAKLIAAAPELLEAGKALTTLYYDGLSLPRDASVLAAAVEQLETAIQKATL